MSVNLGDRYLVLVEFVYKHMGFQIAELESVLEMHGIVLGGPDCQILPLPNIASQHNIDTKHLKSIAKAEYRQNARDG